MSKRCKNNFFGNKTDLEKKEKLIKKKHVLVLENNFIFKETFCVKNENVNDTFETLIEITYLDKREKMEINSSSVKLSNENSNVNEKEEWEMNNCSGC